MLQEHLSIILAIVFVPLFRRAFCRYCNILDKPGHDVPKRERVPSIQGLGMMLALFVITLLFNPQYFTVQYMLGFRIGLFLLVAVNTIDEMGRLVHPKYRLSPVLKFVVQALVAIIAFVISDVGFTGIEFHGQWFAFGIILSSMLTIARFGLCTNAINRFDGVYGLASGTSSIGFFTIASLLTRVVIPLYPEITGLKLQVLETAQRYAWIFAGLTLLAAVMEFRPWGLVREVGTMSFGFALAYLSLLGGAKIGTVIVVLMLPLFDALWVIVDRLFFRKQNPFKGDFTHLHYRLMALGRNRIEVRVVLWSLSVFFSVLMLLQGSDRIGKTIIFLMLALIFFSINGYLYWIKKLPKAYIAGEKSDDDLEKNYISNEKLETKNE